MTYEDRPDAADLPHTDWHCNACDAQNSCLDGECQFCECGGLECKRDNCSAPEHFHAEHVAQLEPNGDCSLCMANGGV